MPSLRPNAFTDASWGRYMKLCRSDPGRVVHDEEGGGGGELQPLGEGGGDAKACGACRHAAPLRSHHCHACRCCVRAFDHHCFWIGTCVGESNHLLFAAYLWVQTVVLVLAVSFTGESLQQAADAPLHAAKVIIMMCLLCSLVMVGSLAVFHVYLLSTGQTTREVQRRACAINAKL